LRFYNKSRAKVTRATVLYHVIKQRSLIGWHFMILFGGHCKGIEGAAAAEKQWCFLTRYIHVFLLTYLRTVL